MSRSDSPQAPPGGWPAQRPQGDYDPNAWTQGLGGAPRPNPQPQQAYGQRPAAAPPPADPYGHQGQGYYWGNDPTTAPAQTARPAAPQFDPYVPATTPSRAPAHQAHPAAAQPQPYAQPPQAYQPHNPAHHQSHPQAQPQPQAYAPAPQPELRGSQYDQWAAAGQPADPRAYDLSSYMPPQSRSPAQAPAYDYGQPAADYGAQQAGYADWGHQSGGYAQQPGAQGYAAQPGYEAQPGFDPLLQGDPNAQGEYDAEHGYDYEEPAPRRSKMVLVAAALAGAIIVGGGLTYAYQALLGTDNAGPTPVVKSAEGPAKVKPVEPGGKQFAHSDSKLLGRLGDNSGDGKTSDADASGSRKVSTVVVGRDGQIQPPADAPPAPSVSVPVPGLTLVDIPAPGPAPVATAPKPPVTATAAAPVVVTPPAPEKPVKVADARPAPTAPAAPAVTPKTLNMAEMTDAAPIATATAPKPPAPVAEKPKPAPVKTAALDPAPAAPKASGPAPTGAGYVAVLASVPASGSSRINALQQFADLQQKYGGILQNKTPDVQEANLGEKGTYHRLIVGPPGSKDGANSVCSQLKSAGYAGCWVMAY